jgi:hypothetical protein
LEGQPGAAAPQSPTPVSFKKFPVGMAFVSAYVGYSLLARLMVFSLPVLLLGPIVLGKTAVIGYASISVVLLAVCLYGIVTRRKWARPTVIAWFSFEIVYSIFDFLLTFAYKAEVAELYQKLLPQQSGIDEFTVMLGKLGAVVFILVINTIVCWYTYSKGDFFVR